MYFNITCPFGTGNRDTGIEKVRSRIAVIFSWMFDNNFIPVVIEKLIRVIETVFP
jgi:hypothetical protein